MDPKQLAIEAFQRFVNEITAIDKSLPWNNGREPKWWSPMMDVRDMALRRLQKLKAEPS